MEELFDKYLNYIKNGLVLAVAGNAGRFETEDAWLKGCTKVKARPISVKGQLQYQLTRTVGQKELHENMSAEGLAKLLTRITGNPFKQVELTNSVGKLTVLVSKKGKKTILEHNTARAAGTLFSSKGNKETAGSAEKTAGVAASGKPLHNRKKNYCLPEGEPVPFLVELGVMTAQGKVVAAKYDKFRQINRYLEFVEDIVPSLPSDRELSIIDFGCGKSYLTFALYYYLHNMKGFDVRITGLDLKEDVIRSCSELAKRFGYEKLQFLHGDIASYEGNRPEAGACSKEGRSPEETSSENSGNRPEAGAGSEAGSSPEETSSENSGNRPEAGAGSEEGSSPKETSSEDGGNRPEAGAGSEEGSSPEETSSENGDRSEAAEAGSVTNKIQVDMVVTLHACDTATDYALEKAVKWGARVIFCVPCCQHELNKQIKCEELQPILKYGLLKERIAALMTDGLRANMLEEAGYRTQILEFIDMEHTPKNILIRAVRQPMRIKQRTNYRKTAEFINADPMLQRLLEEK